MKWFSNIRIAPRLLAGFLLVALFSAVVGGTSISALNSEKTVVDTLTKGAIPGLSQMQNINEEGVIVAAYINAVIINTSPLGRKAYLAGAQTALNTEDTFFSQYFKGVVDPKAAEYAIALHLRSDLATYRSLVQGIMTLEAAYTPANIAKATALLEGPALTGILGAVIADTAKLQAILQKEVNDGSHTASTNVQTATSQVVAVSFLAASLAIFVGILISLSISRPLARLTHAADRLAAGDTAVEATLPASSSSEVGRLSNSFRIMVRYLSQLARAASAVAGGDLTQQVPLAGQQDVLGKAFNTMVSDLQTQTANLVAAETKTRVSAERLAFGVTQLIEDLGPAADGDLTARPTITAEAGDIAMVADFTGVLITTFSDVARTVRSSSNLVQNSSNQLTARVQQLAREVQERSIQVNETAAIAEQIADSATEVLKSVGQVDRSAQEAVESVDQGNNAVTVTLEHIDAMRANMMQATRQIKKLSDSSQAMNNTIALVLQFAGDLELLADNAQVEAARHKEAGGVFTTVAEQTGRLADDAQKALTEIQAAVLSNRQEPAEVGRQMEQVATEVVASARAVEEARTAFNNITRPVRQQRGFVDHVNGVAAAQVHVANSVSIAMQQIITFFGQTADGVRLSEMDAGQLHQTIDDLRGSIAFLKIESGEVRGERAA